MRSTQKFYTQDMKIYVRVLGFSITILPCKVPVSQYKLHFSRMLQSMSDSVGEQRKFHSPTTQFSAVILLDEAIVNLNTPFLINRAPRTLLTRQQYIKD